jgi:hypothetical protein
MPLRTPGDSGSDLLFRVGPLLLLLLGLGMMAAGIWKSQEEAVATALVVFGGSAVILATLLGRMEGPFKIGPGGLEAVLRTAQEKAETEGLPPEEADEVVGVAARTYLEGSRPKVILTRGMGKTHWGWIAEQAFGEVADRRAYEAAAMDALQQIASSTSMILELKGGQAPFDAVVSRDGRSIAVEIRSAKLEPGGRLHFAASTLLAPRASAMNGVLVILNLAPNSDEVRRSRSQLATAFQGVLSEVVGWRPGDDVGVIREALEKLLAV